MCMSVVTGSESGPLASPSQFHSSSSCFKTPHMKLIRVPAHKGGPGSRWCTNRMDQGERSYV